MSFWNYFDLGLLPDEPVLGKTDRKANSRRARRRFWLTLAMYLGILLGILGENLLNLVKAGTPLTWENFGGLRVLSALIITTVIFPQVFPKVFGRKAVKASQGWQATSRYVVQFCVAFQNGFFWHSLLMKLL